MTEKWLELWVKTQLMSNWCLSTTVCLKSILIHHRIKDRSIIQKEAFDAWVKAGKKGTFEMTTGTGKTIAALMCLNSMPVNDGKVHIFLAETNQRELDLNNDLDLFKKLFNIDLRKKYTLVFKCYQGVYNLRDYEFGLVIADECHNSLTPEYYQFFRYNKYDAIVGLSATVERSTSYDFGGLTVTKGDMLDRFMPVCYRYTMKSALKDNIGRHIDIYMVGIDLNSNDKTIIAGSKDRPFTQTEREQYEYLDKSYKRTFYGDYTNKDILIRTRYKYRSDFLNKLPHKINQSKELLKIIPGKTVVFGTDVDVLLQITEDTVNSKNTPEKNKKIRDDFNNDLIHTIGSFKMLRQGANLKNVDNCLLLSYYSKETHIIQQVGRLRKSEDKIGNVVIFYYRHTFEEDIAEKLITHLTYRDIYYVKDTSEIANMIYGKTENK